MKALRYLLIAVVMVMTSVCAQAQFTHTQVNSVKGCTTFGQEERQYQFRSTSSMLVADKDKALAEGGAFTSGVSTGTAINAPSASNGPRRERPNDNQEPMEDPIGDGMWVLLLLAFGLMCYRYMTRSTIKDNYQQLFKE